MKSTPVARRKIQVDPEAWGLITDGIGEKRIKQFAKS